MPGSELTTRILFGMGAGVLLGVLLNWIGFEAGGFLDVYVVDGLFHVVGSVFLASLKLLVVPLVFVSIVCGTAALDDLTKLGRVGGKTLVLYLVTTAVAISLALIAASIIAPGAGLELSTDLVFESKPAPPLSQVLIDLFPSNPVRAMAEGNMLQIIVFSVLFGVAMTLSGDPGARVLGLFKDLNEVIMRLVFLLMNLAPYGVFCLITGVFADEGYQAILALFQYFIVVLGVLFLHALVTYPTMLRVLGGLGAIDFFKRMRDPMVLAFSTASSNATLPVTLENAERRLGADNSIASFTIPLGATLNMDGTAIMQGVATAFIAQAYGFDLSMADYLTVVLTATLASIGTAGVPGVGLVMLAMVLRQVNLPVEGIALIIGVDRLLDMVRTAVNVTGDSAVTCVVAKSEGKLDLEKYRGG
ncbi:MAG: dicarboxylate/amino acid:cation symporter [Deltaproteobacteria bacterium]|nr:dicarboxylate/amino acid:cation symporter [Myxococcales bacterium]TDJ11068.1 MAG: dicarboxylate/amino acid:cation symporter [Deltaproteobacteria bacterium]TDJ17033.1 MAG: dicarboxylate/amino acid:cation symporter [Deltaproteobacteria bacterium]